MDIDKDVAALAARQHGAFAAHQVRALGGDRHVAKRRCQSGRWELATGRVLRMAGAPVTPEQRLMINVLDARPDAVASHQAAAWLWGLPGFAACDVVIRPRARNAAPVAGTDHRPLYLPGHHRTEVRGIPCTTLSRTIFDLAGAGLPLARLTRLVHTVVSRSAAMLPALHRMLEELASRGRPGITAMRLILAELPLGSKVPASGLEGRFEQIARNAGIRELERQLDVGGHSWLGRVDFAIPRLGLLIEIDSITYHSSPLDVARDGARDEAMLADGRHKVLRISEEDIWYRPHLVVQALLAAIRELELFSV